MSDATLRSDGAGFYQLVCREYSFSAQKSQFAGRFFHSERSA
ncbi:DUF2575 domain-containing protein [Enterobacter sp. Tr-810]|nr:DUF2575 domain-containing protein [Enterobacter sp. Tr-810]